MFTGAAIVKDLFLSWVVCQIDDSAAQKRSNGFSLEGITQNLSRLRYFKLKLILVGAMYVYSVPSPLWGQRH